MNSLFKGYAVLGDDIVIYDSRVAKAYHSIIIGLGVECNLSKSIISPKGLGMEFAKRIFFKGMDVSPAPLKELHSALASAQGMVEYGRKYKLSIPSLLKVAGFGYKVIASSNKPFPKIANAKVKYLIFSDYLSNPSLLTAALRAKLMGVSLLDFSQKLETFALNYGKSLVGKYLTAMNSYAKYIKNESVQTVVTYNLAGLWAFPYMMRSFSKYQEGFYFIRDRVSYKWNNPARVWLNELHTPEDRIKHSVTEIQAFLQVDSNTTIFLPESLLPVKVKTVEKRPGFPGLFRIQTAWMKFYNSIKPQVLSPNFVKQVSDAVKSDAEVTMGSFIPLTLIPTVFGRVGFTWIRRVFLKIPSKPARTSILSV
jgi:hypothetical protein